MNNQLLNVNSAKIKNKTKKTEIINSLKRNYELYLFLLPTLVYFLVFRYYPMYGVQIAFKNFNPVKGYLGSPWVGLQHFQRFFNSYQFMQLLKNTLGLSFLQLLITFPIPIILALLFNQVGNKKFKSIVQTVTYAPHFISIVVIVGMMNVFLSPSSGLINIILKFFGVKPVFFMALPELFKPIYIASDIWQSSGYNSVIYLAALAAVNPELYEASTVDGANKFQRMLHIDIPCLLPTMVTLLILNSGRIMSVGFEKAFLMQNPMNLEASEIISTYVYKVGLINAEYSFSTAVGLFNSVINLILLFTVNHISKRVSENSLW